MTALLLDVGFGRQERTGVRPLLLADWREALFVHHRVDAAALGDALPPGLEVDLFDGHAFVSLVLFTQARLRPARGGRVSEWLSRPLGRHAFLNVRTYVHRRGRPGIYFLAEWIPNRLAVALGPRLYGLPYRLGQLEYTCDEGLARRRATGPTGCFECAAAIGGDVRTAPPGSLAEFLVERYAAYTFRRGVLRRFRIAHAQWPLAEIDVRVASVDLFHALSIPSLGEPVAAHYSPGVYDVKIGWPERMHP